MFKLCDLVVWWMLNVFHANDGTIKAVSHNPVWFVWTLMHGCKTLTLSENDETPVKCLHLSNLCKEMSIDYNYFCPSWYCHIPELTQSMFHFFNISAKTTSSHWFRFGLGLHHRRWNNASKIGRESKLFALLEHRLLWESAPGGVVYRVVAVWYNGGGRPEALVIAS